MNNLDTVIINHLVRVSPDCANSLMRLNKKMNHQIKSNKSLIDFLIQYFKNKLESPINNQLKRIFHIYSQPNKIVALVNTRNNKYGIWFSGNTYKVEYDFIESESSKNGIEKLSKLKDDYFKIIKFEEQQNKNVDKSLCDVLDNFLLSLPVNDHFNGLVNTSEFLLQFFSLLIMYIIGMLIENRLSDYDYWIFVYIIVVILLLIVLSYYHLYIKNRHIAFLA